MAGSPAPRHALTRHLRRLPLTVALIAQAPGPTTFGPDVSPQCTKPLYTVPVGIRYLQQAERFQGSAVSCNAEMTAPLVRRYCQENLTDDATGLLRVAVEQFQLSARAYHRVLKLSRTIADLAGEHGIAAPQVAEALQCRRRSGV